METQRVLHIDGPSGQFYRQDGHPITAKEALKDASPGGEDTRAHRQLTQHTGRLWEFLHSGRYTGDPRQIAYAMAGVPKLAWRTSLDRGVKAPSAPRKLHTRQEI